MKVPDSTGVLDGMFAMCADVRRLTQRRFVG